MKSFYFVLSTFLILGTVACQTEPVVPAISPSGARTTATASGPIELVAFTGVGDPLTYINNLRVRGCIYKGKTYPAVPALTVDAKLTPADFPVAYPVSRYDDSIKYLGFQDLCSYMGGNAITYKPVYGIYYNDGSSMALIKLDALFNIGVGSMTSPIIAPQGIMTSSLKRFSARNSSKGYKFIIFSK